MRQGVSKDLHLSLVLYQGLALAMPKPPARLSRNQVRGEAAIKPSDKILANAKRPIEEEEG